jgi:hypothetical protein
MFRVKYGGENLKGGGGVWSSRKVEKLRDEELYNSWSNEGGMRWAGHVVPNAAINNMPF